MLENELNKLWKSASNKEAVSLNTTSLVQELDSRVHDFDALLKKRNAREYTVFAVIGVVLVIGAIFVTSFITKMAFIGLLCWSAIAAYKIYKVAKLPLQTTGLPIQEYLLNMKAKLVKERQLVNTVAFWYILPPLAFEVLFLYGQGIKGPLLITASIPTLLIAGLVFKANRMSVKKEFDPLIEQLDNTILSFNK